MLYGPLPHNWLDLSTAKLKFTWPRSNWHFSYNSNHIRGLGAACLIAWPNAKTPKTKKRSKKEFLAHSHHKYFMLLGTQTHTHSFFSFSWPNGKQPPFHVGAAVKTAITIRQTECCLHKLSSSSSISTNNNNNVTP